MTIPQRDEKSRFLTGNNGGPGRPVGARNKLGKLFLEALHDDFAEHGLKAIVDTRVEKPDQYLKVIASLMPKEMTLNLNDEHSEMTDDELINRIRRLNEVISPFLDAGTGRSDGASPTAGGTGALPH